MPLTAIRNLCFSGLLAGIGLFSSCSSKTVVLESSGDELDMNAESETEVLGKSNEIAPEDISNYLREWIDTLNIARYISDPELQKPINRELHRFYNFNGYKLAWSNLDGANTQSRELLNALAASTEHGLEPEDYHLRELVYTMQQVYSRKKKVNLIDVIHLDMDMTLAYLTYAQHLFNGRINPNLLGGDWDLSAKQKELAQYMGDKDVRSVLSMLEPRIPEYKDLKQQLSNYRAIAEEGGWPKIPQRIELKEGSNGDEVYLLRKRLTKTGDVPGSLKKSVNDPYFFDAGLTEAVKRFQKRHGLEPDGIVKTLTVLELNKSVEQRIEQIKVNLERIRWMPRDLGYNYLMINIPAYTLQRFSGSRVQETYRVIVGSSASATPVVSSRMESIIFSPTWNVPGPIFIRRIIPQIQKNPKYLDQNGYVLYASVGDVGGTPMETREVDWDNFARDYPHFKCIQKSGPENQEGNIKFVFPNNYNLFLSDAAKDEDFSLVRRDFNYRCISVERAISLAETLIADRHWREDDIRKNMDSDRPVKVILDDKMPLYIVYNTCWVDDDGELNFRPDIYGFDEAQYQLTKQDSELADEF